MWGYNAVAETCKCFEERLTASPQRNLLYLLCVILIIWIFSFLFLLLSPLPTGYVLLGL